MWKKEDAKAPGASDSAAVPSGSAPVSSNNPSSTSSTSSALRVSPNAAACISQGIKIKGEVTGSEDLFVDGHVEGKLSLTTNCCLTIGPNGSVKADLNAREIIVRGKVEGKVTAREKVQLWSTGEVRGEVQTDRLAIEDGALLLGRVEAGKQTNKPIETKATVPVVTSKSADAKPLSSGTAAD